MTELRQPLTMKYSALMEGYEHSDRLNNAVWHSYRQDLENKQFHSLIVVSPHVLTDKGHRYILAKCMITKRLKWVSYDTVMSGRSKSFIPNGRVVRPYYKQVSRRWMAMRDRCNNPQNPAYHRYGGRGIKCLVEREELYQWVLKTCEEKSCSFSRQTEIDRVDNNGHYELSNLRFSTRLQNLQNRSNTLYVSWGGVDIPLAEWVSPYAATPTYYRIKRGMTGEQIVEDAVRSTLNRCKHWKQLREKLLSMTLLTQVQRNALQQMES